ncbi:enoyl-CoA hydratase/isomerase family protein [Fertoebacter nigrum]|uniref:enoyl-CoA hydratase n=1 Tax=Fertoeibacter niger TaxID=2656921 RepID=A0A8X8GST2_9RHOB|nr:enoyl-CoA hydratase-related protein [Fertoeibacter niger]NUB43668.1 enoyl-CoA hydratase/isomerase family protein [Fertoeibacter niger]
MAEAGQQVVQRHRAGEVMVLVIDHPPVNALGHALRAGLAAGLAEALADDAVQAVVIRAEGRTFPAGADLAEFGQPPRAPVLPDLCNQIEASPKPVIAALHGTALGGGLEIALAAHARVALASTRLGLPEVHLGILPGAGGTQRLPRLIGAAEALRLMLTGRPVGAAEAMALGLVDQVVEDGLEAAALAMARTSIGLGLPPTRDRREGLRDVAGYQAVLAAARKAQGAARLPGPGRIIDCVEAALLLPFAQGLAFERAAFLDLVGSPEAIGLRHVFFAERRAAKMPEARVAAPPLAQVGILGTGDEAADLALALVQAGLPVTLAGVERPALVAALERIAGRQEQAVAAGTLTAAARDADWARLQPALGAAALTGADLVLALPGEDAGALPDAVTLGGGGPGLSLQLPPGERLAELVVPQGTAPARVAQLLALARKLGRVAVWSAVPGGIGARVRAACLRAAAHLVAGGTDPARITAALAHFGFDGLVAPGGEAPVAAGKPLDRAGIMARLLGAMANEGARVLGEGGARCPSDIDLALVLGQGFPRWEGGPMFWAERQTLLILRRDLRVWAADAPQLYTPAPLLDELFRQGLTLGSLNEG